MVCPISGRTFPVYVIEDDDKGGEENQIEDIFEPDYYGRFTKAFHAGYECQNEQELKDLTGIYDATKREPCD